MMLQRTGFTGLLIFMATLPHQDSLMFKISLYLRSSTAVLSGERGLSTPAIGFNAILSKDTYLGDYQTIKYDRVLTNIGNGYNKWSGHFTAPLKGLYVFSCTVMAVNGHNISVVLVKNGQKMMLANSSHSAWETGAISAVLVLNKGDTIWIRRYAYGRYIYGNYNIFSGYLISGKI